MRPLSRSRSSCSSAVDEIAAQGAAQAAALQQHHAVVDRFDQQMIETDLAELVDDHGGLGERRVAQQPVEQRGLAGAEEAGEHAQRNGLGRTLRARCAGCGHCFSSAFGFFAAVAGDAFGEALAAVLAAVPGGAWHRSWVPHLPSGRRGFAGSSGRRFGLASRLSPSWQPVSAASLRWPASFRSIVSGCWSRARALPRAWFRSSRLGDGDARDGAPGGRFGPGIDHERLAKLGILQQRRAFGGRRAQARQEDRIGESEGRLANDGSSSSVAGRLRCGPHISSRRLGGCMSTGCSVSTVPSDGVSQDSGVP